MRYLFLITTLSLLAFHLSYGQQGVEVKDAWVRETPPGSTVTALYLNISNKGAQSDTLNSVSTNISKSAEMHKTSVDEKGLAKMEMVKSVTLGSGDTVVFEPGGMHIMLLGLERPIKKGDNVEVDLIFENAGEVSIKAEVLGLGNSMEKHGHHH